MESKFLNLILNSHESSVPQARDAQKDLMLKYNKFLEDITQSEAKVSHFISRIAQNLSSIK